MTAQPTWDAAVRALRHEAEFSGGKRKVQFSAFADWLEKNRPAPHDPTNPFSPTERHDTYDKA
jgi:hypothetical protein